MSQLGLQHRVPLKLNPPLNFCSGGRNDDQGLRNYARLLKETEAAWLLQQTLDEEGETDK